jgi:hypothetical protein
VRLRFLLSLGPDKLYRGRESLRSHGRAYIVAVFKGLAIAECPDYGNALYAFRGNGSQWQSVFQRSKKEARKRGAVRVVHDDAGDWMDQMLNMVRSGVNG